MYRDVLTEEELKALLSEELPDGERAEAGWEGEDRKLLHALVRNQLRLLHMIEELQGEVRKLRAAAMDGLSGREAGASLEPLPLPFIKQRTAGQAAEEQDDDEQKAPAAESRKERYKRRSFW